MTEFIVAYQTIFNRMKKLDSTLGPNNNTSIEIISALRYGVNEKGDFVFEIYSGSLDSVEHHIYKSANDENASSLGYFICESNKVAYELLDFNKMILEDAQNNLSLGTKIYWWIDIAMSQIDPFAIDKYIAAFGLPNDGKFRYKFGQFRSPTSKDQNNFMYAANGLSKEGETSSLSLFPKAMYVANIPIVAVLPKYLRKHYPKITNYIMKRFLFVLPYARRYRTKNSEYISACEGAYSIGEVS